MFYKTVKQFNKSQDFLHLKNVKWRLQDWFNVFWLAS